jgi:hypothetical protein
MRRWIPLLSGLAISLLVALCIVKPWRMTRQQWITKTTAELRSMGPPPSPLVQGLKNGWWVTQHYLIFSNDWACFACNTFHDSERIGDVGLLLSSTGQFYISRHHFCTGLPEDPTEKRPANLPDFFHLYEKHNWAKVPGG